MNKVKSFLRKYGSSIAVLIWAFIWALAFTKSNHLIEDSYINVGVMGGWLWMLLFGCKFFNWGRIKDDDAEVSGEEQ